MALEIVDPTLKWSGDFEKLLRRCDSVDLKLTNYFCIRFDEAAVPNDSTKTGSCTANRRSWWQWELVSYASEARLLQFKSNSVFIELFSKVWEAESNFLKTVTFLFLLLFATMLNERLSPSNSYSKFLLGCFLSFCSWSKVVLLKLLGMCVKTVSPRFF